MAFNRTFSVTIEGSSPMMIRKFTDAAAMDATSGTRKSTVGESLTPYEDADSGLYKDSEGNAVLPQPNLFRCIIDAGAFMKIGKKQISTQKTSLVPACVCINELFIRIQHKGPWTVDSRPVRIPSTGGRILRHRPMFNDWKLPFTMMLDDSVMSAKILRQLVDIAGSMIGLGEFRPACKGPYGRFVVTSWKEVEKEVAIAG